MYSAAIVIAAILYIQQFILITAFPNGAYNVSCTNNLQPGHLPNQQPVTPFPYLVTISNIVDDEYIPGYNYTITLRGTRTTRIFRGFLIQARSTIDNEAVGTFWVKPNRPSRTQKYKPICMENTGATHVNNTRKRKVKLHWTAPPAGTGSIQLCYSFVKIHRPAESRSIFWAGIKSNVIHEFKNCTIKGQIKMECAIDERCAYTCDNRNYSIQCSFPCVVKGCQCPEGQVVNELTNECVEPSKCPAKCPVEGQKRTRCAVPENCTQTCDNKNESIQCPMDCNVNGCQCPQGTIVNTLTNQCVQPDKCPAKCPIVGQIRKICAIPENCTQTCDNKNESIQCPMDCNVNGCQCPQGTIVNTLINQCVQPDECPAKCPVVGQIRKICAIPENCTRTCDNLKEALTCHEICNPYGCECPNGTVVNHITKECVKPEKCPLDEACPLECSHDNCRRKKRNTRCSIPNDSGYDTSCLDNCNTAFCVATYYSTGVRTPSESCTECNDPTDMSCLFTWSKCVRRADKASYDSGTQNPENFKYFVHPCQPENS